MDRVVDDLKMTTRKKNENMKRFVSDSDWVIIDKVNKLVYWCDTRVNKISSF